ncbi:hypothetical protein K1719_028714 [Acacia pycnantha]|nr:hypothetical protein K1719_028714 [Acacia pycnantha]
MATPPEDPIKCSSPKNTSCTITNSYGVFPDRTTCSASQILYPTSEDELVSAIAFAAKNRMKMKVATRYSHSIPKLVCPDGENNGLLISTKYLNQIVKVDVKERKMVVESGVTLRQLIDESAKVGLALPYGPYWWGLTIGGLMGTGAHGSSMWGRGSSVHDHVVEVRVVVPTILSQITIKLEPMFKRSITYLVKNDSDLGDKVASFGRQHEFADITWYPSQHKAVYRVDDRVPINTSGNGLYDFLPFRPTASLELALVRTIEDVQESTNDANGKCLVAKTITDALINSAYGLTNNGIIFTGYPVIGFHNRLQASGTCLDSVKDAKFTVCAWDSRVKGEFFHQTTFSIPLPSAKAFIEDVQKLVQIEPKSLCGQEFYNGILMRYVKTSSAFLGKQDDAIDFDITYYRSKDPTNPRLYEDILEEIEQLGIFKYGGLPHWGKNRNLAFDKAIRKYKFADKFLKVKERFDPQGLFSSEWTDQVLGLKKG